MTNLILSLFLKALVLLVPKKQESNLDQTCFPFQLALMTMLRHFNIKFPLQGRNCLEKFYQHYQFANSFVARSECSQVGHGLSQLHFADGLGVEGYVPAHLLPEQVFLPLHLRSLLVKLVAHQPLCCFLPLFLQRGLSLVHLDEVLLALLTMLQSFLPAPLDLRKLPLKPVLLAVGRLDGFNPIGDGTISHLFFHDHRSKVQLAILHILHIFLVQLVEVLLFSPG